MLSEREQKAELRGAGLKAVLSATDTGGGGGGALLKLGAHSPVCGKSKLGSWPAPHGSDGMQQVCTKYFICSEACARAVKGTDNKMLSSTSPKELPGAWRHR